MIKIIIADVNQKIIMIVVNYIKKKKLKFIQKKYPAQYTKINCDAVTVTFVYFICSNVKLYTHVVTVIDFVTTKYNITVLKIVTINIINKMYLHCYTVILFFYCSLILFIPIFVNLMKEPILEL